MENIVQLAEYRKRRKPAKPAVAPADIGAQYFCTRCDADQFRLFASGKAHCAHCGAMMRNLAIKGDS